MAITSRFARVRRVWRQVVWNGGVQFEGWSVLYVYGPLLVLGGLAYGLLVCASIFLARPDLLPPIPLVLLAVNVLPLSGGVFLVLFARVGCRSGSLTSGAFPFRISCPLPAISEVLGEEGMVDLLFDKPGKRMSHMEFGFVRLVTGGLLPIPWCHTADLERIANTCRSSPTTGRPTSIANRITWRSNIAGDPRLGNGIVSFLGLSFLVSLALHSVRGSADENELRVGAVGVLALLSVGVWSLVGRAVTDSGVRVSALPWQRLDISGGATVIQPSSWDAIVTTQPAILDCSGQERVVAIDPVSLAGLVLGGSIESRRIDR